jgi:hypothetical protein
MSQLLIHIVLSFISKSISQGLSLTVESYESYNCVGSVTTIENFPLNVCAASSIKYGLSVDVKCTTTTFQIPLKQDSFVERYLYPYTKMSTDIFMNIHYFKATT